MDLFNIICGVCSIVSLLITIFTASKVAKITQILNSGNTYDQSKTKTTISDSTIHGSVIGRDSTDGTRNCKQN